MLRPTLAALLLTVLFPRPAGAQTSGHLVIVGGGSRPASVMSVFVEAAGGPGADVLVIPNASADPERAGSSHAESLRRLGADASFVVLDPETADAPAVRAHFEGVTGVWFPGGVQSRLMDVIGGTRAARAIREVYNRGGAIGGSSAGAAVMTTPMITGAEARRGEDDEAWETILRDNVGTAPGLALLEDAIVDQHFVRRKRHNRLISLVLENPSLVGAGIDESTALWVKPDGSWEVVGESVVVIYDARSSTVSPVDRALGAANMRMHVLPHGARFDPVTGVATMPDGPMPGPSRSPGPDPVQTSGG